MELLSRFAAGAIGGLEVLSEDGGVVVGRGWRDSAGGQRKNVLFVLSASEQSQRIIVDRLAHEYSFRDQLDSSWAIKPLELAQDRGQTALVLEDPGGELLGSFLGTPMEITRFLRLAVGLAAALGRVHQQGLVHKDIKPANILVNIATDEVRLTGFGVASRLTRERQPPDAPGTIAGTLPYMAPEQTGRMNRSIDSRSDLYALGVTFYEMLTGSLPFKAAEAMEWIHCHIARRPQPPDERTEVVPAQLSAIVMKLMAKTAEERYQTAAGLERDLRRCQSEWETLRRIDAFPLGERDVPDRFLVPEKLYGRERDVETLLAAFDRVLVNGSPELVLVSGYSGIGKSAVVNELHKMLVLPRALFASGKFDQYKRDIPYSTLAQAFQLIIRQILGQTETELAKYRETLIEALGANGLLIVNLVPELKVIIGEQPPIPELPPQEAKGRFQVVFRRFISAFARAAQPLVLFLDDLQWLDAATLDLLEDLLTQNSIPNLLLIGAYRDNEVDASHPLSRKLDAIKTARRMSISEIKLRALNTQNASQLIADALHCEPDQVEDLAQTTLQKTDGNPFFINQFLSSLTDEGLIAFDTTHSCWWWDLKRIHAKGYTDNVADLMIEKLIRLPVETQNALQQLACLGNIASAAMLTDAHGTTEQDLHANLLEARRQELVYFVENSYRFAHDRVHEAAYALIPIERRDAMHLRIGRMLIAHTPADKVHEVIFEIVNQLNRAASLVTAPEERDQLAEFNLLAGRHAQASSAYVSALTYLTKGSDLLENRRRERRELDFAIELARAHCEFASGAIIAAEERLRGLSVRAFTTAERVAVASLQVDLYQGIDRSDEAVAVGLRALRHLGIELPERPTEADARLAYDNIWTRLGERAIDDLVDLPPMNDQDSLAALDLLIRVAVPGHFVSFHMFVVAVCRAVSLGLERGHSEASCIAYVQLGTLAGPHFGDFDAGYRFGRLGCELVERPGLERFQARTFETFGFLVPWTQHVRNGREFLLRGLDLACRIGEISYAGYACGQLNTNYLMAGDPLSEAQKQAEDGLAFARKVGFGAIESWILGQLGLIRSLRGLTIRLGSFEDTTFREIDFERELAANPALALTECWYFIRKVQAGFFSGEYMDALRAAARAQPMLWNTASLLEIVEYHFYDALCHAAVYDTALPDERKHHHTTLVEDLKKLSTWALHCPQNFANRAALVGAEIARIEGRQLDAELLYEQAIRSAREHGFVQNEGLAHEVAARFYAARGFEITADAHLHKARDCYLRWGAVGKVRQLDGLYPHVAIPDTRHTASAIGSAIQQVDVASVVKASQALSSEIELPKLIEQLMKITIENAGADRGLLILPSGDTLLIQAEARANGERIEVTTRREPIAGMTCPESLVRYVIRTQESVILDDASKPSLFSADDYLRDRQPKSMLCLPLIKQRQLIGTLLLENTLTTHAFTPARIAVLELLAAQAAISLENTRLYSDLREREAKVRRLVDSNIVGICIFDLDGRIMEANDAFLDIIGYGRDDLGSGRLLWTALTPPEWNGGDERALAELASSGTCKPFEKEYFRKDGSRVPVLLACATFGEVRHEGVAFVLDQSERKRAEAELAHANRVAAIGQLSASIAHEVNQPIAATLTNAGSALRWLARQPPNLGEARQSLDHIISDTKRAADIVNRIRDFSKKAPERNSNLQINEAILEIMGLTRIAISEHGILVRTQLSDGLPRIFGDRVQLQQVMLNLIMNAVEAISEVADGPRNLLIKTRKVEPDGVLVAVSDSGPGLPQANPERLFEAFYTTKASGLGMGLSICRSIVQNHGGRLWATPNQPRGATFYVMLPIGNESFDNRVGIEQSKNEDRQ